MDDTPGPVPSLSDLIRGCNKPTLGEAAAIYFSVPAVGFHGLILMIPETHTSFYHQLGTEVDCLQSYSSIMNDNEESSFIITNSSGSILLSILLSSYLDQIGMTGISKVQPPTSCQRPTRGSNRSTVSLVAVVPQDQ